jgi:hypothetical protein
MQPDPKVAEVFGAGTLPESIVEKVRGLPGMPDRSGE